MWCDHEKKRSERMEEMKRDFLKELGLESDVIDKILDENSKDIGNAKKDLEAITKERDEANKTIADRDKQLETLKNASGDIEGLKKQIEALQGENKSIQINAAVEKALTASKAKNLTAVKALIKDLDKAELLEDGSIKGLEEQIKGLKIGESTKFLFEEEVKPTKTKITGSTPVDGKDGEPKQVTKEQFTKMSYEDRAKLYNEDKELYQELSK